MTTACDILKGARELISDPSRWTVGLFAVDANGLAISPRERGACKFCAVGAIRRVRSEMGDGRGPLAEAEKKLNEACRRLYGTGTTEVNDFQGHASILEAFDFALKECQP